MESDLMMHERFMAFMGLGNPAVRALTAFTVTNGLVLALQPSWAFDHNGNFRAWKGITLGFARQEAGWIPWWAPSIAAGIVFGVFI